MDEQSLRRAGVTDSPIRITDTMSTRTNTNNKQKKGKQGIPRNVPKNRKKNKKRISRGVSVEALADRIQDITLGRSYEGLQRECIKAYARALINPFTLSTLPCNPTSDPGLAVRLKAWTRGTFAVGTLGVGFIVASTGWCVADGRHGFVSSATYPSGINLDTSLAGVGSYTINSPYLSAEVNTYKVVGYGMRIWYTGRPLDCSGNIYRLRYRENTDQNASVAIGTIEASRYVKMSGLRVGETYYTTYVPSDTESTGYSNLGPSPAPAAPIYDIGFLITGCTPGVSFAYEICGFYEVQSDDVRTAASAVMSPQFSPTANAINSAVVQADASTMNFVYKASIRQAGKMLDERLGPLIGDHNASELLYYVTGVDRPSTPQMPPIPKPTFSLTGKTMRQLGYEEL